MAHRFLAPDSTEPSANSAGGILLSLFSGLRHCLRLCGAVQLQQPRDDNASQGDPVAAVAETLGAMQELQMR